MRMSRSPPRKNAVGNTPSRRTSESKGLGSQVHSQLGVGGEAQQDPCKCKDAAFREREKPFSAYAPLPRLHTPLHQLPTHGVMFCWGAWSGKTSPGRGKKKKSGLLKENPRKGNIEHKYHFSWFFSVLPETGKFTCKWSCCARLSEERRKAGLGQAAGRAALGEAPASGL